MNRGREAESARRGNDEYYEFSPLGFLGDSYFTQPPYYSNNPNDNPQVALAQTYTGSASSIIEPTVYSPYYSHTPMDLDVLSADNYQRDYAQVSSIQRGREHAPLFGITTDNRLRTNTPSPPAGTRARRSRKESLKGTSADEASSARQRGRPRLDTKDQTAAERRRTQIRLAQRAYRQRKETTISGLNGRVASLEKTIEDMHKSFLEFNDRAIAAGIEKGAPALAGHLKSTADRLNELAKNSTEDSEAEEDENESARSVQSVAADPRSRRQGRELGSGPVSMLGYQATFGEEEDEDEEDAGEIAAPPIQFELNNHLPLSNWTGTEKLQQLRNEDSISNAQSLKNLAPVLRQQQWVGVVDSNIKRLLRSKELYLDGQCSVPIGPTDPSLGSEETPLPLADSPYGSPSLNSSEGPQTPESRNGHWANDVYSNRNGLFRDETTNVSKASDMDIDDPFDGPSIRV